MSSRFLPCRKAPGISALCNSHLKVTANVYSRCCASLEAAGASIGTGSANAVPVPSGTDPLELFGPASLHAARASLARSNTGGDGLAWGTAGALGLGSPAISGSTAVGRNNSIGAALVGALAGTGGKWAGITSSCPLGKGDTAFTLLAGTLAGSTATGEGALTLESVGGGEATGAARGGGGVAAAPDERGAGGRGGGVGGGARGGVGGGAEGRGLA